MLVDIAYKTQGNVTDVQQVIRSTDMYRGEQDVFTEFYNTYIQEIPSHTGYGVKLNDLMSKFKEWIGKFYSGEAVPNGKEVREFFEKKHGKYPNGPGWMNISYKLEFKNPEEFS